MARVISIDEKILRKNSEIAEENRDLFNARGICAVNLVGTPGAGKTTLLEKALPLLKQRLRVGVVEGDIQTDRDASRVERLNVPVVQVVTNGTCHLEAHMVQKALGDILVQPLDLVFIENVGNLVCPSSYDLGEHLRIVIMSVTEGEDKPLKYPAMFRKSNAVVINKADLLPYCDFNIDAARRYVLQVNPGLEIHELSARTGHGIQEWVDWLVESARR